MRFIILSLLLAPVLSYGQVSTNLSTDKESYEYGEQINISFVLFNGSDSTLFYSGSSTCQFHLEFQHIETYPITCTTDDHRYSVYPNQKVEFDIEINPSEFFYPVEDGLQKIVLKYYLGFKDSVEFSAPQFRAGSFNVSYDSLKSDSVQQIKDSLSVIETDRYVRNIDKSDSLISISATWTVDRFQVDELVENLNSTGLFRYIEIYRLFNSSPILVTTNEETFDSSFSTTLSQNYPNPFNPTTTFSFELSQPGKVRLSIFNIVGQEVAILQNNLLSAGKHAVNFDGSNLSSGTYFYMLKTDDHLLTKKFTLIK
jgi:hypothetical protein